ncbi:MAG: YHS domain-containing protein [Desulfobulbus sp.]|uniref:YHS domain-containing protein n=1 Tax=Desulfobulbus sp. TaxID=895 RepID=UPI00284DF1C2|nr:YHS domain-containing protein [Desulfobulbus sp.]MDR2548639.1 YHS domain-containing protein [Desulfobulbus sp.]
MILALLLYVGWRVLRGRLPKKRAGATSKGETTPQDVLVEDPVCHVLIPKHQALRLRQGEKTYYFCSERCCDQFAGKPEQQGEV